MTDVDRDSNQNFSDLKELRRARGISQKQLSEALGIDLDLFKAIEERRKKPMIEEAEAIADYLNINIFNLFSEKRG